MDDRLENLEELTTAIDRRLDVVFYLYGVCYNISTDGTPFIAVCPDGNGDYYKDADDLVNNYLVDGKPLAELWPDIEIDSM